MEFTEIEKRVDQALEDFLKQDKELLEININERTISHKLAEHLQRQFDGYNVDCEYNRYGDDVKKITRIFDKAGVHTNPDDINGITVYPDIIVHRRRSKDKDNLLVIEVKKSNNSLGETGKNIDREKLQIFTHPSGEFKQEFRRYK